MNIQQQEEQDFYVDRYEGFDRGDTNFDDVCENPVEKCVGRMTHPDGGKVEIFEYSENGAPTYWDVTFRNGMLAFSFSDYDEAIEYGRRIMRTEYGRDRLSLN